MQEAGVNHKTDADGKKGGNRRVRPACRAAVCKQSLPPKCQNAAAKVACDGPPTRPEPTSFDSVKKRRIDRRPTKRNHCPNCRLQIPAGFFPV